MYVSKILHVATVFITSLTVNVGGSTLRVVGGYEAPENFGDFHASLQNVTGHHVCGGAVISRRLILTAAHCIKGAYPHYIKIVVGAIDLDVDTKKYDVETIFIHEDFNFPARTNDIAILKVSEDFNLTSVRILEISQEELVENDTVVLLGFGAHQPHGQSSRQLHALNLPVFSQDTCRYAMRYSRNVTSEMFCTFTKIGQGTCHGDSGSPLVKGDKLVGIVSWGIPCAVGYPDVHTRLSSFADWVQNKFL